MRAHPSPRRRAGEWKLLSLGFSFELPLYKARACVHVRCRPHSLPRHCWSRGAQALLWDELEAIPASSETSHDAVRLLELLAPFRALPAHWLPAQSVARQLCGGTLVA